jgi:hypothetical protein
MFTHNQCWSHLTRFLGTIRYWNGLCEPKKKMTQTLQNPIGFYKEGIATRYVTLLWLAALDVPCPIVRPAIDCLKEMKLTNYDLF